MTKQATGLDPKAGLHWRSERVAARPRWPQVRRRWWRRTHADPPRPAPAV